MINTLWESTVGNLDMQLVGKVALSATAVVILALAYRFYKLRKLESTGANGKYNPDCGTEKSPSVETPLQDYISGKTGNLRSRCIHSNSSVTDRRNKSLSDVSGTPHQPQVKAQEGLLTHDVTFQDQRGPKRKDAEQLHKDNGPLQSQRQTRDGTKGQKEEEATNIPQSPAGRQDSEGGEVQEKSGQDSKDWFPGPKNQTEEKLHRLISMQDDIIDGGLTIGQKMEDEVGVHGSLSALKDLVPSTENGDISFTAQQEPTNNDKTKQENSKSQNQDMLKDKQEKEDKGNDTKALSSKLQGQDYPRDVQSSSNLQGQNYSRDVQSSSNLQGQDYPRDVQSSSNNQGQDYPRDVKSSSNLQGQDCPRDVQSSSNLQGQDYPRVVQSSSNLQGRDYPRVAQSSSNNQDQDYSIVAQSSYNLQGQDYPRVVQSSSNPQGQDYPRVVQLGPSTFHVAFDGESALDIHLNLGSCYDVLCLGKKYNHGGLMAAAYKTMSDDYLQVLQNPTIYGRLNAIERDLILEGRMKGRRFVVVADIDTQATNAPENKSGLSYYDSDHDGWHMLSRIPSEAVSRGCSMATLFNYIFIVLGSDGLGRQMTPSKRVFCYNPLRDSWKEVSSLKEARPHCKLVALDGCLYAIGGECLHTVERYDPRQNKWSYIAPLPNDTFAVAHMATAYDDEIYVTGGTIRYMLLRYNHREKIWKNSLISGSKDRTTDLIVANNFLYRFDLNRNMGISVHRCNIRARIWYECASYAMPYPSPFQCVAIHNNIYCISRNFHLRFLADEVSPRFMDVDLKTVPVPKGILYPLVLVLPVKGTE